MYHVTCQYVSFIFLKVVLQFRFVVSSSPIDSSLFSVCFSSLPEVSFGTFHRKPVAEGWKVWVWAQWAAGTLGYIRRIYNWGFPVSPGELPWWLRWWSRRPGFDSWVGKIPQRREWQPTPVLLPGESQGQRSLVAYSPWGRKESDTTEQLTLTFYVFWMGFLLESRGVSRHLMPLISFWNLTCYSSDLFPPSHS